MQKKPLLVPSSWVKTFAATACLVILFVTTPALFSMDTFIGFFAISFSLKLIELHEDKDALVIISIAFISVALGFLYSQHIALAFYFCLCLVVLLMAWRAVFERRKKTVLLRLRAAATSFLQVVPLMMILFVSMPRLGQLWHMPSPSAKATTGFSESMSPGGFNELIESNAVAFRVGFENNDFPQSQDRYWRGLVLEAYDGVSWQKNTSWLAPLTNIEPAFDTHSEWSISSKPNSSQRHYNYSVLLEPHQQVWLFALMLPLKASSSSVNTGFTATANLRTDKKVRGRISYDLTSALHYGFAADGLGKQVRDINLTLPRGGNNRSRQRANRLREKYGEGLRADLDIIEEVLNFYTQNFTYTLKPDLLRNNHIDEFLFDTQRGFCEHFSSSFVFLMRAAGIPARVVVGYQGGEVAGDYMIVRQRDAHAWAEVWLQNSGWVRYDPTAAVSPLRIERGLSNALSDEEQALVGGRMSSISIINWTRMRFDSLSYSWHRFVLSYDDNTQQNFFNRFLGGSESWRVAAFFICASAACMLLYFAHRFWPGRRRLKYDASKPYCIHLNSLEGLGCAKSPGETPTQFARRASTRYPMYARILIRIAEEYETLVYSGHTGPTDRLCVMCKTFAKHVRRNRSRLSKNSESSA